MPKVDGYEGDYDTGPDDGLGFGRGCMWAIVFWIVVLVVIAIVSYAMRLIR